MHIKMALTSLLRSCRQVSNAGFLDRTSASLGCALQIVRAHHEGATGGEFPDNKFYELRTYKIRPAHFPEFIRLTNENMHLRTSHSKLVGYWSLDIGGLNEVFHIWEYECFASRAAVRATLAKDENWIGTYFSKALQMLDVQENLAANLLPWKPLQEKPFKEGGVYELRQYVLNPGGVDAIRDRIMLRDQVYTQLDSGKLIGAWMGDIGQVNTIHLLWNWENADKRVVARKEIMKMDSFKSLPKTNGFTPQMYSKMMTPLPFSPLN